MLFKEEALTSDKTRIDKSSSGSVKLIQPVKSQQKDAEPDFMQYIKGVNLK